MAFKVYQGRDEKAWKQKYLILAKAFQGANNNHIGSLIFQTPWASGFLFQRQLGRSQNPSLPEPMQITWTTFKVHQERYTGYLLVSCPLRHGDIKPRWPFRWPSRSGNGQLRGLCSLGLTAAISDWKPWLDIVSGWLSSLVDTGTTYLVEF